MLNAGRSELSKLELVNLFLKDDPVRRRWRKWKHLGEDEADDSIYDEDYEPEWMKGDEQGWAIGRRIYEKSEIEVNYFYDDNYFLTYLLKVQGRQFL